MNRTATLAYGLFCHLSFLLVFAWMALFVGDLLLERTIDSPAADFRWSAVAVDLALLAAFGLQHSLMARPGWKRWWTTVIPAELERSTYVLVSCVCVVGLLLLWQTLGPLVWDVQHPIGRPLLWGLFAAGWLMIPVVSLLIDHFDLFGTRQVWLAFKGRAYTHRPFGVPGLYRVVRHPLYVGWMLAFWATPTMSVGHLLFALGTTAYMLLAIPFEERDLVALHGEDYARYRATVPALLPRLGRRATEGRSSEHTIARPTTGA